MTFEAFQQVIMLLKKNSEKSSKIYSLGLEIFDIQDELHEAIAILLKSHYSKEGEEIISWWLWESSKKIIYDKDGNKINDLTKIKNLWEYVEEIRKFPDFEEYKPQNSKKRTKKQLEKLFGNIFNSKK